MAELRIELSSLEEAGNCLVVVETEDCSAAKERVIHVDVTGIVVRVRVPETPANHLCYDQEFMGPPT